MRAARFVAAVWVIHGLFNKLLGGSPRHLAIVQSVPGLAGRRGAEVLVAIGVLEVGLAVWVLSGLAPRVCAATQTVALLAMNATELTYARHLLLWPAALLPVNLVFLAFAWTAAGWRGPARVLARLRRHPFAIQSHFDQCLALTYALPADRLRPLLPPGLELETLDGWGFVAVAFVQARALRPAGLPAALGQDFLLVGYRIFTRFRTPAGRSLRGLRILRSDTDRAFMQIAGNMLTHYNYHRCRARVGAAEGRLDFAVITPDAEADVDVSARLDLERLPPDSPFRSEREARRFAGPLPFTFDYERETDSIVAIQASRGGWRPRLVDVDVRRMTFFDRPPFRGCTPRLAAAFRVADVEYRWERGVRHAL